MAGQTRLLAVTSAVSVQPAPVSPVVPSVDFSPLYGVRGWLLLFCIAQVIVIPLVMMVGALQSRSFPSAVIDFAFGVLTICVGMSLWCGWPHWFRWVNALFIVRLAFAALLLAAVAITGWGHLEKTIVATRYLDEALMEIGFVIIWWAYFKKSERVRVTYGRNL